MVGRDGRKLKVRPGRRKHDPSDDAAPNRFLKEKVEELEERVIATEAALDQTHRAFAAYVLHQQRRRRDLMQVASLAENGGSVRAASKEFASHVSYVMGGGSLDIENFENTVLEYLRGTGGYIPDPPPEVFENTAPVDPPQFSEEEDEDEFEAAVSDLIEGEEAGSGGSWRRSDDYGFGATPPSRSRPRRRRG